MRHNYCDHYNRYRKFSIEEVRSLWENARHEIETKSGRTRCTFDKIEIADGITVKMESQRYQVFFEHGTDCVKCGLKGAYFWLEQCKGNPGSAWHFNLYGVRDDGTEILMTKDHIVPKSKGGKNHLSNYQPMCARCNATKGNNR